MHKIFDIDDIRFLIINFLDYDDVIKNYHLFKINNYKNKSIISLFNNIFTFKKNNQIKHKVLNFYLLNFLQRCKIYLSGEYLFHIINRSKYNVNYIDLFMSKSNYLSSKNKLLTLINFLNTNIINITTKSVTNVNYKYFAPITNYVCVKQLEFIFPPKNKLLDNIKKIHLFIINDNIKIDKIFDSYIFSEYNNYISNQGNVYINKFATTKQMINYCPQLLNNKYNLLMSNKIGYDVNIDYICEFNCFAAINKEIGKFYFKNFMNEILFILNNKYNIIRINNIHLPVDYFFSNVFIYDFYKDIFVNACSKKFNYKLNKYEYSHHIYGLGKILNNDNYCKLLIELPIVKIINNVVNIDNNFYKDFCYEHSIIMRIIEIINKYIPKFLFDNVQNRKKQIIKAFIDKKYFYIIDDDESKKNNLSLFNLFNCEYEGSLEYNVNGQINLNQQMQKILNGLLINKTINNVCRNNYKFLDLNMEQLITKIFIAIETYSLLNVLYFYKNVANNINRIFRIFKNNILNKIDVSMISKKVFYNINYSKEFNNFYIDIGL